MKYSIDELRKVKGIGEKTIERIKQQHGAKEVSGYNPIVHIKPNELIKGDLMDNICGIDNDSVDLIVTDPPYKTTTRGNSGGTGGLLMSEETLSGKMFKHNDIDFNEWLPQMYRVLKEGGHAYFMTNNKNLKDMLVATEDAGFKVFKTLVWAKNTPITNMWYMDSHEYIIFARKGKAIRINDCGTKSVLGYDNPRNKMHPTQKPIELMEVLIKNSSNEGDVVLDPFMGSGSTGVAAYNAKRQFIGIELDNEYFKVAKKRIKEAIH